MENCIHLGQKYSPNYLAFLSGGKVTTRFVSSCPEIIPWLIHNGYQPYPEFDVENENIRRYDDYFKKWFGGKISLDQIWGRNKEEATTIYKWLVSHP